MVRPYRRTKKLRAMQRLPGHFKLQSTVRYLGIEVDDTLEILACMGSTEAQLGVSRHPK